MFTTGILDVFMEQGITFPAVTAVSAGVLFGCNYKSRQIGRSLRYNLSLVGNKEYMSWRSLWRTGNYVNTDFSFRYLPFEYDPMDFDTFAANPMRFWGVCTDIESGQPVYHEFLDAPKECLQWMRASSSMPVFARPVEIDGHYYLDGGITDSIPLAFMQSQGYERCVIILTQPVDYRKHPAHVSWLIRRVLPQFPKVADLMAERHIMYNHQLDFISEQARLGNALLIYPDETLRIGRLELNARKMQTIYEQGRRKALEMLSQIREFVQ